jgi:hypothetical protein
MKNLTLLWRYEKSVANYIPSWSVLQVKYLDHLPINGKSAYEVSGKQTLEPLTPWPRPINLNILSMICVHYEA